MTRISIYLSWTIALAISAMSLPRYAVASDGCTPTVVGDDTSNATNAFGPVLGRAFGQVFFAPETLITEIDVWRPAGYQSVIGAHLFISGVDTTRMPMFPDISMLFQDGPTVTVFDSDPPGQLILMPFVFMPPIALPRPGYYTIWFQAEDCYGSEGWRLLFDTNNHYADGISWSSGRAQNSCHLAPPEGGAEAYDMVFEVHFCDNVTPSVRHSWGQVKALYR